MEQRHYRVLHIFSGYGGGISSLIINLIENKTDDFDFDVMAFSYKNGEKFIERLEKVGSNVFEMPRPRVDGYKSFKSYVEKVMTENQYDAVHCHITGWSMLPFYRMAKKAGIRNYFLHAHTTTYDRKLDRLYLVSGFNRFINYKCASAFFTCSDLAANYIYGKYQQIRPTTLIPNGIAKELFSVEISDSDRQKYFREFGIDVEDVIILHVGRFNTQKNHDFILDIADALEAKGYPYKMLLVGEGDRKEDIQGKCKSKGINNVMFLGRRSDISLLMQLCDLMILPSFYEGLPTVAIECQAVGTPMLLSTEITRQCDMNMGLLKFLPIDMPDKWVQNIEDTCEHIPLEKALTIIDNNGFTAQQAGIRYCQALKKYIL